MDDAGGQIKATMFKEAVDLFDRRLRENGIYLISGGVLKPAEKRYSRLPNDYEMTLNTSATVRPVASSSSKRSSKRRRLEDKSGTGAFDGGSSGSGSGSGSGSSSSSKTTKVQFDKFTSLRKLAHVEAKQFVNVIGVLVYWAPLVTVTSKSTGKEMLKRSFTLLDKSKVLVNVTIWDKDTTRFDEISLPKHSIVAIKNAIVSDYAGGRSLNCSAVVVRNPDVSVYTSLACTLLMKNGLVIAVPCPNGRPARLVPETWGWSATSRRPRAFCA